MISQPDVTVNIVPAATEVGNDPHRVLAVGQKTSAGSATAGDLVEDIRNGGQEDNLFGENSMLAGMIRNFKKYNQVTRIDAIALDDDGSAVDASGSIALSNNASSDGSIRVAIGSQPDHTFEVAVSSGDTPSSMATALASEINADNKVPVSASASTGTVNLTAVNGGEIGNDIGIVVLELPEGVSVSLTAMSGGTTNPDLTGLFDPIDGERYQTVIWPGAYSLTDITNELDGRFNVTNDILDGVAITTLLDTFSNVQSTVQGENSETLTPIWQKQISKTRKEGPNLFELSWAVSAQFAGIRALRLTEDANIAEYTISTNGARDSFGGTALASFPYFNTPFKFLPLIPSGEGFSRQEIEDLYDDGAMVIGNNPPKTEVISGEAVTTKKTDSAGNTDTTFKHLNAVDTSVAAREYFWNNLRKRFAQSRLTNGDLIPNRSIANEDIIASYLDKLYTELAGADFVLTQAGEEALQFFRNNRNIILDLETGKVTINMQTPIVTQLRTIVATMQIAFSTNS